jgi:hypothetical protein
MAIELQGYRNEDELTVKPLRAADQAMLERMKPGRNYKITELRSRKGDGLYFKALDVAAELWPEGKWPEPAGDAELLRYALQIRAGRGWRKQCDFPPAAVASALAVIEAMRGDGKYAFTKGIQLPDPETGEIGDWMRTYIPISISHDEMGEVRFAPLRKAVIEQIEITFGCDVKELIARYEMAAIDKKQAAKDREQVDA